MNFLEKFKMENSEGILSFLSNNGFTIDTCGWGCCKGWKNIFTSTEGLYYNHVIVRMEDEFIKVTWHQEYNCGGETAFDKDWIPLEQATEEYILQTINDLLPNDLD